MKTDSVKGSQQIGSTSIHQPSKTTKSDKTDLVKKIDAQNIEDPSSKSSSDNFGVSLSPKAMELAEARKRALQVAHDTPAVREDKVAEIKKKIQDGTYQVDSGKIADGMMREAVRDELSKPEYRKSL